MLDLTHANDFQRTMDWSVYDRFTLVTPSGQVLSGILRPEMTLHEGFNLKSDGLVFKLVNHDGPAWTAIYTIGFKSFFRYALGSLLSLGAGLAGLGGLGWAASRWYRRQVILPANQAHAAIAESEAFSRVVIDTAPQGCVWCAGQIARYCWKTSAQGSGKGPRRWWQLWTIGRTAARGRACARDRGTASAGWFRRHSLPGPGCTALCLQ